MPFSKVATLPSLSLSPSFFLCYRQKPRMARTGNPPYGVAVPSLRGRPCGAAPCAPRLPLGRAREFRTFSRTPGLSPLSLSHSTPYSRVTHLRPAWWPFRRLPSRRPLSTRGHRRGKIGSHI